MVNKDQTKFWKWPEQDASCTNKLLHAWEQDRCKGVDLMNVKLYVKYYDLSQVHYFILGSKWNEFKYFNAGTKILKVRIVATPLVTFCLIQKAL